MVIPANSYNFRRSKLRKFIYVCITYRFSLKADRIIYIFCWFLSFMKVLSLKILSMNLLSTSGNYLRKIP